MLSRKFITLLPVVPIAVTVLSALFSPSCANTTTPPTGGPKDTIPPVLVGTTPSQGVVCVPVSGAKFQFTFNEYVVVKNKENVFLSPPLSKRVQTKIKGKSVIVTFPVDLDSNKTYVLDLTEAIGDNNEGNMFQGYTQVFSTGEHIDSMMMTGTVLDNNTLMPVKGATVMLYKDHRDSALFLHRPDAAIKTDEWGWFVLRNIQDTLYRLYAIMDSQNDNIYDPDVDLIAFCDTLVQPVTMVSDSLKELRKYDMKDTVGCQSRASEYELRMYKGKSTRQMIKNHGRTSFRAAFVSFLATDVIIDTMWIKGVPHDKLITQMNNVRDSMEIWIDNQGKMPDTLYLNIKYHKTDTLGQLVPTMEVVKLAIPKELSANALRNTKREIKKEDTTAVFTLEAKPELVEQYGFVMSFNYPLISKGFDKMTLRSINPRQQESKMKFTVTPDSTDIRKFTIRPNEEFRPGFEYYLKVPAREFRDINGFYNDSLEVKVTLPNDEKASLLSVDLQEVDCQIIVDLLDEKKSKVLRSYNINSPSLLKFPYLTEGKYCIRITEDRNGNGIIDIGNLFEKKQPEKVRLYSSEGSKGVFIDIPPSSEVEQVINVKEMFK
ncbi:MAG: Ig-like domain-containing protein [Bacteroidales bacterium]|nr:Ig-like domain-containing protein [Bacteroidales bacterium]